MSNVNSEEREQSIAQLFRELSQETAGLVREELGMMRDELKEHGRRLGAGAGLLGGAGMLGLGAFGALTAGLVAALGRGRPGRGALLVSMVYGGGAAGLALLARERLRAVAPDAAEAADTVHRDMHAAAQGAGEGAQSPS
jgi:membrane protein